MVEKKQVETLSAEQINYARSLIDERHGLLETPWRVTWPFLKYTCCCFLKPRKKSFKLALKHSIRRRLEMKIPSSDQRIEENPFLLLGYGMNSYF